MLIKVFFVFGLFICEALAWHHSSHRRLGSIYWPRRKPNKGLFRTTTKMPSGALYNITIPTTETTSHCPSNSTLIDLNPNGKMGKKEFHIVKSEMEKSWYRGFAGHQIVKIQKISNPCLWKRYKHRKETVRREAITANEQMLFHGSAAALQLANRGFDERYASPNGLLGAGIYFARHGSKSDSYNSGSKVNGKKLLLLCRVALGRICVQKTGNKLPHAPPGCHSVAIIFNVPEFVVYRGEQVYPEYLITYS